MTSTQRSRDREALIDAIPWVDRITEDKPCQGIKWSRVALKHLYSMSNRPAEGIPERARCTFRAKWHFTALPDSDAKSGDYCIHHLMVQFATEDQESDRYRKWLNSQDSSTA